MPYMRCQTAKNRRRDQRTFPYLPQPIQGRLTPIVPTHQVAPLHTRADHQPEEFAYATLDDAQP